MKSRKTSLREQHTITKPEIIKTRSQSDIPSRNKSTANLLFKKSPLTLQQYSKIFIERDISGYIGDADTHFRKTLRKYDEYYISEELRWFGHKISIENKTDQHSHIEELSVEKGEDNTLSNSDIQLTINEEKDTNEPNRQKEIIDKSMADEGDTDTIQTIPAEVTVLEVEQEQPADNEPISSPEEKEDFEDANGEVDETIQSVLDRSFQELKEAVEGMDAEYLDEIASKMSDRLQDIPEETSEGEEQTTGDTARAESLLSTALIPQAEGDMPVAPSVDFKVLQELEIAEQQAQSTANIINELKERVAVLLNKKHMTEDEAKELDEMNKLLMQHMEDFEVKTKMIQTLITVADQHLRPVPTKLPAIQARQPEDMLPKVIICGMTENNMPKIIICDADKKKAQEQKKPPPPPPPTSTDMAIPQFAKRLSESYDMQEKLAADNVELEGKRFQLQEHLLNKDKTCEVLQRQVCGLQTEMRILLKENTVLNDKLAKVQGKCRPHPDMPCQGTRVVCPADVENRLQRYSQNTHALEKQVVSMEAEVKKLQDELAQVQRDRLELEQQRKEAAQSQPACPPQQQMMPQHVCRPNCHGPCRPGAMAEQQLRELREQYNRLQDDYKAKVTEVAGLRADTDKLRCACKEAECARRVAEDRARDMEDDVRRHTEERTKLLGTKEQAIEQEQQLAVAKQRFREAQDELEELRALIGDQASELESYRNKYLQAQQQVEEQRRQIDVMEMESGRVSEQVTAEIQRVKSQFQERLAELSPLPDILKATQLKLHEEQQLRVHAERNAEQAARELLASREREQAALDNAERARSERLMSEDERTGLQAKVEGWECRCAELQRECDSLRTQLARAQEAAGQHDKRLEEKTHEIVQLTAQLENVREESARQVSRIKDRCETVRRGAQSQVADLERQLAQARANARTAQKERDDIRHRMQAQINNLNENFEEAQMRIRSLQGHVNFLKSSYTNIFGSADVDPNQLADDDCECGPGPPKS